MPTPPARARPPARTCVGGGRGYADCGATGAVSAAGNRCNSGSRGGVWLQCLCRRGENMGEASLVNLWEGASQAVLEGLRIRGSSGTDLVRKSARLEVEVITKRASERKLTGSSSPHPNDVPIELLPPGGACRPEARFVKFAFQSRRAERRQRTAFVKSTKTHECCFCRMIGRG